MPFYEYECPSCRHHAEVMQKISDAPLKKCPACGKSGLKRLISAPVFRLKGSGWYETDFKSDKEGKRNLASGEGDEAKAAPDGKPDAAASAAAVKSDAAKAKAKAKAAASGRSGSAAKARPVKTSARRGAAGSKATARHK